MTARRVDRHDGCAYNMKMEVEFETGGVTMAIRGKYQTKQKETIAAYFQERPDACLTAEAVYAALGMDVGMTTVYRAVARLCDEGFLRRYAPQTIGEAALYQLNPCKGGHMHIRCVDCGTLAHLHCDVVRDFAGHLLGHHGFVLDEGQTVLYGRCQNCQAKRDRESATELKRDGTADQPGTGNPTCPVGSPEPVNPGRANLTQKPAECLCGERTGKPVDERDHPYPEQTAE